MSLPDDVTEILDALLSGARQILKGNLAGVYLRGSLAHGGFRADTSDVDVLAVTETPVGDAEFDALAALHAQLASRPNPYGNRLEIAYIERAALRRFRPGLSHPTRGQGSTLARSEHHSNWILERWTVREHGVTLLGPNPRTLIDPISSFELHEAVRARLGDWADWARAQDDPEWIAPRRGAAAYVVETMCRALHTLACGELTGKAQSVAWALDTLPEPWRSTVELSQEWRTDAATDPSIVPQVMRFVLWAAAHAHDDARVRSPK